MVDDRQLAGATGSGRAPLGYDPGKPLIGLRPECHVRLEASSEGTDGRRG